MRILFVGEIVAKAGRNTVVKVLPSLIKEKKIDLVIANAENVAHGRGVTVGTLKEMQDAGVNYFTSGDHIFGQKGFDEEIDSLPVLRPANYPEGTAGKGWAVVDCGEGGQVLLINLMGRTSFGSLTSYVDDPFRKVDEILEETGGQDFSAIIVDFHGEATSEKMAFAFYVDGRVTAVCGTHTHVPTCDNFVLPKGTMYVSDVGMTGVIDSVLGVKKEIIINMMLTAQRQRFEWESAGRKAFRSVILDLENNTVSRFDKYI